MPADWIDTPCSSAMPLSIWAKQGFPGVKTCSWNGLILICNLEGTVVFRNSTWYFSQHCMLEDLKESHRYEDDCLILTICWNLLHPLWNKMSWDDSLKLGPYLTTSTPNTGQCDYEESHLLGVWAKPTVASEAGTHVPPSTSYGWWPETLWNL